VGRAPLSWWPEVKSRSGLQDQSLGNWRIKRQVLEGEDIAYKFTPKYVLRAGQTVTVGTSRR
jgi:hypothetical protein